MKRHPACHFAVLLALLCLAPAPASLAVTPPPDGGYANDNTAEGDDALFSLTTGYSNVAVGTEALFAETTGWENTAVGWRSLYSNTTGFENIALGTYSLYFNTNGAANTALGYAAMTGNKSGSQNTAVGYEALFLNSTGTANVGVGLSALYGNFTGSSNVAVGEQALCQLNGGSNNIGIGFHAGDIVTGNNNITIGNQGRSVESGVIRIGTTGTQTATYVAGIRETPLVQGAAVAIGITADGQLGVRASSARFKDAIKPMAEASEALLALKPVTFRYKKDPGAVPQFGLVAEDVAKVDPDLVARDESGKPFTVRYEAVNAMLLNEFLKEHRKVEEQGGEIAELKAMVAELQSGMQKQGAQLQKVNARLEASPLAPRVVSNGEK